MSGIRERWIPIPETAEALLEASVEAVEGQVRSRLMTP
jgi:hypothetical protein